MTDEMIEKLKPHLMTTEEDFGLFIQEINNKKIIPIDLLLPFLICVVEEKIIEYLSDEFNEPNEFACNYIKMRNNLEQLIKDILGKFLTSRDSEFVKVFMEKIRHEINEKGKKQ